MLMLFEFVPTTVDINNSGDNNDNCYDRTGNNSVITGHWWFMNEPKRVG